MPVRFAVYPEHDLVLVVAHGRVTLEDLLHVQDEVNGHPSYALTRCTLVDGRGADLRLLSADIFYRVVDRSRLDHRRRALVVDPGFAFGVARMLASIARARGQETEVFTSLDEACRWADVDPAILGLDRDHP